MSPAERGANASSVGKLLYLLIAREGLSVERESKRYRAVPTQPALAPSGGGEASALAIAIDPARNPQPTSRRVELDVKRTARATSADVLVKQVELRDDATRKCAESRLARRIKKSLETVAAHETSRNKPNRAPKATVEPFADEVPMTPCPAPAPPPVMPRPPVRPADVPFYVLATSHPSSARKRASVAPARRNREVLQ